jgi:hypothetical protein
MLREEELRRREEEIRKREEEIEEQVERKIQELNALLIRFNNSCQPSGSLPPKRKVNSLSLQFGRPRVPKSTPSTPPSCLPEFVGGRKGAGTGTLSSEDCPKDILKAYTLVPDALTGSGCSELGPFREANALGHETPELSPDTLIPDSLTSIDAPELDTSAHITVSSVQTSSAAPASIPSVSSTIVFPSTTDTLTTTAFSPPSLSPMTASSLIKGCRISVVPRDRRHSGHPCSHYSMISECCHHHGHLRASLPLRLSQNNYITPSRTSDIDWGPRQ